MEKMHWHSRETCVLPFPFFAFSFQVRIWFNSIFFFPWIIVQLLCYSNTHVDSKNVGRMFSKYSSIFCIFLHFCTGKEKIFTASYQHLLLTHICFQSDRKWPSLLGDYTISEWGNLHWNSLLLGLLKNTCTPCSTTSTRDGRRTLLSRRFWPQ